MPRTRQLAFTMLTLTVTDILFSLMFYCGRIVEAIDTFLPYTLSIVVMLLIWLKTKMKVGA